MATVASTAGARRRFLLRIIASMDVSAFLARVAAASTSIGYRQDNAD
jgi:hypothetical protein